MADREEGSSEKITGVFDSQKTFFDPFSSQSRKSEERKAKTAQINKQTILPLAVYKKPTATTTNSSSSSLVKQKIDAAVAKVKLKSKLDDRGISDNTGMGDSLLHNACCNQGVSVEEIAYLLSRDPGAASRPRFIPRKSCVRVYRPALMTVEEKWAIEPYAYPLHLALKHRARREVVAMLIDAAPQVLSLQDGNMKETPLAVLLRYSPHDALIVNKILCHDPRCISLKDRHQNTVVHTAITHGSSLDIVHILCSLHPPLITMTNFDGKTPADVAQERTASCNDNISILLQSFQSH